ncbi:MAG: amino acid permease [Rubrobacter sp.]|nr:amino acid permease [Rubrobacter sp.]
MSELLRKKDIPTLQREAAGDTGLKRTLGVWSLTFIGLGGIIGVGVFVLTGVVAANQAGPAVALSFVVAGIASAAAALCYAEFAGMIPVSGSAYTYGYAVLGEFFAWIIGWDLLIEYTLVVAVVAIGISGYINELLSGLGVGVPEWAASAPGGGDGGVVNLFAVLLCLFIAGLQIRGIRESANFNNAMVILKLGIIVVIIAIGAFFVDPDNLTPFFPYGIAGVFTGAAVVFFAVFGYDTLTTAAEEATDPQRDLPRAVILSLAIALVLYVLMSLVVTGMVPYQRLDTPAPVAVAFQEVGLPWVARVISVAAIAGIISVLFAFMLGAARVWFAMSRDGLLPRWFCRLHPSYRTPYRPTAILGVATALVAGFFPITTVAELVNIGVLSAFIIVCASVWILRRTRPDLPRSFRTPLVPLVPIIGIAFSAVLIASLPPATWARFAVWMAVGLVIYFLYSRRRSLLARGELGIERDVLE